MALCGAIFLDFGKLEKRIKKKCKNERKQYMCQIFFVNFQGNLENGSGTMWRYFFGFWKTRKTDKKSAKMKGNNTFAKFFSSIFKETWKTVVALCGAIFWILEN